MAANPDGSRVPSSALEDSSIVISVMVLVGRQELPGALWS
jgi:hypothetical protein